MVSVRRLEADLVSAKLPTAGFVSTMLMVWRSRLIRPDSERRDLGPSHPEYAGDQDHGSVVRADGVGEAVKFSRVTIVFSEGRLVGSLTPQQGDMAMMSAATAALRIDPR
jgi:hypothetical protein